MAGLPVLLFLGSFLLLVLLLGSPARADEHYYDFVLRESNFTRLCETKSLLTVNDSFPGPVITVHRGDTAYVNVHNHGDYGVTIHWHGVKQPGNPWSDGPEYITQCPIEPGNNFTYMVIFSTEEGTLWWHAHSDWTRSSVHGAIIILPPEGSSYPYPEPDGQQVFVLASWYKGDVNEEVDYDLETGQDTPRSDAYTINGQPGDFCNCSRESTVHWYVDYGKTYLIRLVNGVMNVEMFFAIGQHNLTVVGMDGSYLKPFVSTFVVLSPGQTIDLLVTANQPLGSYYVASRQYNTVRPDVDDYDHANATAIMQYNGNYTPSGAPIFPSTLPIYDDFVRALNFTSRLRSLASLEHPINVPMNITTRMYITASMNNVDFSNGTYTEVGLASSLNNVSWLNPSTDVLMAYYRNISGVYTNDFPDWPPTFYDFTAEDVDGAYNLAVQGARVKVLEYNEQVEVVFQGTNVLDASEDHPMHMHGYGFYVVGSGYGNFDNETNPKDYNLVDPPEVNTVPVPKKGWAAIRFTASNPGVWFWHCHFDRHLSWGMDTVFIVKNGGTPNTTMRDPPSFMPTCKSSLRLKNQRRFASHQPHNLDS
ncbi:hypothetical protein MLD38_001655 [Melastoma candidum]|uniref:Uncharacterized protein n=1 Tax=Melastoma candidum TaxID=119954 RepID=A0ACB9SDV2_9MYRT|nr:hypothetical protein MLD38_001655 [Melastoma candidum]